MKHRGIINLNRVLFLVVFVSNMLCAWQFIFTPENYLISYEVINASGGKAAIQGLGVAFAMWNVTYPFYIYKPTKGRVIGLIIIIQQMVGLFGELFIKVQLLETQVLLKEAIMRFVLFDFMGLLLMLLGYVFMYKRKVFER